VKVNVDVDAELPQVMVDLLQIEQVLINRLRNSIEASSEIDRHDGVISLETSRNGADAIEVRLRDNRRYR
jgi:nitrogen-specific signal transduction histidine kinase